MKSASNGLMMASTCGLLGAGAPIDLKVSTPMMPMTRSLEQARGFDGHRTSHGVADQDDLLVRHRRKRCGHVLAEARHAPVGAVAVGAAVAGQIDGDQRVLLSLNAGICSRQ